MVDRVKPGLLRLKINADNSIDMQKNIENVLRTMNKELQLLKLIQMTKTKNIPYYS